MGKRWTVALALVWVVVVAGCGQPPPSSGQGAGEETMAETTEETTVETTTVDVGGSPELGEAADEYEGYVAEQTALLANLTEGFTDAVEAGDVERAKELYAPARVPWERIEPIAAQLGFTTRTSTPARETCRTRSGAGSTGSRRRCGWRTQPRGRRSTPAAGGR